VNTLELYVTSDITLHPNSADKATVLLNPANRELLGAKLPYFPMPDAPPKGAETSMWGGMEAGPNMFYASQVVDGRVHALGGKALAYELSKVPCRGSSKTKCEIGSAVSTISTGELAGHFEHIIHTATPAYQHETIRGHYADQHYADGTGRNWIELLCSCYTSSFDLAWELMPKVTSPGTATTIASPLLGAGAKLGPGAAAADVAVRAASSWVGAGTVQEDDSRLVLQLACLNAAAAALVEEAVEREAVIWEGAATKWPSGEGALQK
jgi:O-acetyl-ADP-ribose deacetylase (regulator of RNase III)